MIHMICRGLVGASLLLATSAGAVVVMPEIPLGQNVDFTILGSGVLDRGYYDDPDNSGDLAFFANTEGVAVDIRFTFTAYFEDWGDGFIDPLVTAYSFDVTRRDNGLVNPSSGWGSGWIDGDLLHASEDQHWWGSASDIIFDLGNPGGRFLLAGFADLADSVSEVSGHWQAWRISSRALGYDSHDPELEQKMAASPAIPEPRNWALMIAGFGLIGLTLRHRTRASVARHSD